MNGIRVRLPDRRELSMPAGATILAVAERIGPRLARDAVAGRVDGRLVDLRVTLERDAAVEVVTAADPAAGEVVRHSAEHVMADAVKRLFPSVQIDVGRADHAEKFQYDFLTERPFTPEDLERIEEEMRRIVAEKSPFRREVVDRERAKALFAEMGEHLKVSRIDDIASDEEITLFRHGDFVDLCRGPHVQRADQIGAFKLLEVAGAYWRGDERNPMLQRIYGTAFATRAQLDEYLERQEEARRRDHRRLGVELDLFQVDPISPGSPFYRPKGTILYQQLVDYVRSLYPRYGLQEVITPQLFRSELYKTSGHYDMFREDMFLFEDEESAELVIKPMNCPGHCWLFRSRKRSYRELPLRYAEFSRLHRNERSGTLHGLTRVRSMAQDDAHVFCAVEQLEAEVQQFFAMTAEIYGKLGLEDVEVFVATRPEKFIGEPTDWERGEQALARAVAEAGYACGINPGEAAFYGPKVELHFRDALGRSWQVGTLQLDMAMPARFDLRYVGPDGRDREPAMLHRAILGSLERFIAIYLEHTAGDFPLWLAPLQVVVLPITARHLDYARQVQAILQERRLRAEVDERNEKLGFKVREAELQKIPAMLVVGDQEVANGTATLRRRRGASAAEGARPVAELAAMLEAECAERRA